MVQIPTVISGKAISGYDKKGKSIKYVAAPVISSVSNTKNGVLVKWKASSGAVKYRVYRKTGNGSWKKIADTTSTKYTDTKAVSGKTYTYTIRCINAAGTSFTSTYNSTGLKIVHRK